MLLAEKALEALRAEVLFPRSELLDSFDLARDEQDLHERLDQIDSASEMSEEAGVGNETRDDLANLRERLAREARATEGRLRRKQQLASEDLERTGPAAERRMEMAALDVARQFDDGNRAGRELGTHSRGLRQGLGGPEPRARPAPRAEPQAPQARPRSWGACASRALALRRRWLERRNEETFDVTLGRDVGRLLPHELALRTHPVPAT